MNRNAGEPVAILTDDGKDDFASSESGDWVPTRELPGQKRRWNSLAHRTLEGERRRISISIPERDLAKLKTRAAEKGMPYQTLINSILHEYVEN